MTLVRHLPTIFAESFISLWGAPSGPVVSFALSGLIILFISSLKAEGKSKHKEFAKTVFCGYNTRMVFVSFNDFLYCSAILTLGIRIADSGGSLSRNGLCSIYVVVINNFSCFFRVVFKDSTFFKCNAIFSYHFSITSIIARAFDCIQKLFTAFFVVIFRKYFLAYCVFAFFCFFCFFFFVLLAKMFSLKGHLKYKFLDLDLFIICLLSYQWFL